MILVFVLLTGLRLTSYSIIPDFKWYLFCGFCLALSVIAPGMSFSTLLMPLGLYMPFVDGIGHLSLSVLIPSGIGALLTMILVSKGINYLFKQYYSVSFHAIVGIVITATIMIIPFDNIFASVTNCIVDFLFLVIGVTGASLLDRMNQQVSPLPLSEMM